MGVEGGITPSIDQKHPNPLKPQKSSLYFNQAEVYSYFEILHVSKRNK